MEADMLPGAPVGNQRGFRTNLPITPGVSLELLLRGLLQLRTPIETLISEVDRGQLSRLGGDALERLQAARLNLDRAVADPGWANARTRNRVQKLAAELGAVESGFQHLARQMRAGLANSSEAELETATRAAFLELEKVVGKVADLNDESPSSLPRSAGSAGSDHAERAIDAFGRSAQSPHIVGR
jgi:hypothetical protein